MTVAAPEKKDVVIIGGGISGLATAYYLHKAGLGAEQLLLLEKENRFGGTIRSEKHEGCVLDAGPDSFLSSKPWALELCRDLGLEGDLIAPNAQAQHVYLLRKNQLSPLPRGIFLGVPTDLWSFAINPSFPAGMKLRMLGDLFLRPRVNGQDVSIAEFFSRHFGQTAVDLMIEPILAGIYAASAERLSLQETFPQFIELEKRHGSLIRGMLAAKKERSNKNAQPMFYSLRQGLEQLPRTLVEHLPAQSLAMNSVVSEIIFKKDGGFEIRLSNGQEYLAENLILATPPLICRRLMAKDETLGRLLQPFEAASTATIFLGFRRQALSRPLDGFGFVVPRSEASRLLACTWISSKFPARAPKDVFLLRCFVGGAKGEQDAKQSVDELITLATTEVKSAMGIEEEPLWGRVFYWPELSPQYAVGQGQNVKDLEVYLQKLPRLKLLGNAYHGVGIPDCVRLAKEAAQQILQQAK